MKRIQISEYGSADVLREVNTEIPKPQNGEIQIKVNAIGVNYSDILRRQNMYFMPTPLPHVLGTEAVGTVSKIGDGVQEKAFQIGSKVLAILFDGGYSEYVTANAQFCVPLPPHINEKEATAIFVQGTTAHLLIHEIAKDIQGKTILVHAAAGGVGSLIVQLGKLAGAKVIASCSTDEKLNIAKELGADILVNYTEPEWINTIQKHNDNQVVDIIFDGVGGKIFDQSLASLKPYGKAIVFGASSGEMASINSGQLIDRNISLHGFNLGHFVQNEMGLWQTSLSAMISLIASNKIKININNVYPLAKAAQAHSDIENRKTTGKVVLINQ